MNGTVVSYANWTTPILQIWDNTASKNPVKPSGLSIISFGIIPDIWCHLVRVKVVKWTRGPDKRNEVMKVSKLLSPILNNCLNHMEFLLNQGSLER